MSFSYLKKMPDPDTIKSEFALTPEMKALKADRDQQIADIITGKDDRVLAIIGPCSADNEDSVCEYVNRLTSVQEKIKDRVLIVPRIYTNKPRTTGSGYKGIASQPDPTKAPDMVEGLIAMRKRHLRAIAESGFTCADEMLYPENWPYVEDLLSYVAIGARSVEDQHHRLTVSGFDVASGMKNPTSGDFSVMLNSVYAAQHAHHFTFSGYEVRTTGNPLRSCAGLSASMATVYRTTTTRIWFAFPICMPLWILSIRLRSWMPTTPTPTSSSSSRSVSSVKS